MRRENCNVKWISTCFNGLFWFSNAVSVSVVCVLTTVTLPYVGFQTYVYSYKLPISTTVLSFEIQDFLDYNIFKCLGYWWLLVCAGHWLSSALPSPSSLGDAEPYLVPLQSGEWLYKYMCIAHWLLVKGNPDKQDVYHTDQTYSTLYKYYCLHNELCTHICVWPCLVQGIQQVVWRFVVSYRYW